MSHKNLLITAVNRNNQFVQKRVNIDSNLYDEMLRILATNTELKQVTVYEQISYHHKSFAEDFDSDSMIDDLREIVSENYDPSKYAPKPADFNIFPEEKPVDFLSTATPLIFYDSPKTSTRLSEILRLFNHPKIDSTVKNTGDFKFTFSGDDSDKFKTDLSRAIEYFKSIDD